MADTPAQPPDYDIHLRALAREMRRVHAQIADLRKLIADNRAAASASEKQRAGEIAAITDRLDELEETLMPTFFRVFPRQGEFLDEVDRVLASRRDPER